MPTYRPAGYMGAPFTSIADAVAFVVADIEGMGNQGATVLYTVTVTERRPGAPNRTLQVALTGRGADKRILMSAPAQHATLDHGDEKLPVAKYLTTCPECGRRKV